MTAESLAEALEREHQEIEAQLAQAPAGGPSEESCRELLTPKTVRV